MLSRHSVRLSPPAVSVVAALAVGAAGCGGRIVDDLPPLPPPSTPPIVAVTTAKPPTAVPAPRPAATHPAAAAPPRPAAPLPASPPEPAVRCALSGRAPFPLDTVIQAADGKAIARLSGADVTVNVSELTLAARPRARLETGTPRASFRVRGWVDAGTLPLVTTQALAVRAGHLWIGERRGVAVKSVQGDRITVERAAAKPLEGTFSSVTSCSALSLDAGTPPAWTPPGEARGYALRQGALDLFDAPGGNAIGTLNKAADQDAVLFFSTEQSGGYVHIERHADIVVDAWARAQSLSALPRGETLDQLATPTQRGVARLAVPGEPRVVKTTREIALRAGASDTDPVIGSIAPDTETYLVDVVAGWASVLPRALDVMPADRGQFWAKKTDLER